MPLGVVGPNGFPLLPMLTGKRLGLTKWNKFRINDVIMSTMNSISFDFNDELFHENIDSYPSEVLVRMNSILAGNTFASDYLVILSEPSDTLKFASVAIQPGFATYFLCRYIPRFKDIYAEVVKRCGARERLSRDLLRFLKYENFARVGSDERTSLNIYAGTLPEVSGEEVIKVLSQIENSLETFIQGTNLLWEDWFENKFGIKLTPEQLFLPDEQDKRELRLLGQQTDQPAD
jgi:hypothetical protein